MPVWHLSVSVWSGAPQDGGRRLVQPKIAEREAVKLLRGVGGQREWWIWNPDANVGHLRVGVTPDEHGAMTCGVAEHDAGDTGPERPRT